MIPRGTHRADLARPGVRAHNGGMGADPTPFQMARISVRGGIGAGLLVAVLVGAMLADLPLLRGPVLGAIAGGLLFGAGRIAWRRRRAVATAGRARRAPGPLDL
jgi:hypothetical protein